MPGQRRFVLFIFVGVIVLLLFWHQPVRTPTIAHITSYAGSVWNTQHGEADKVAQNHPDPPSSTHTTSSSALSTSKPVEPPAQAPVAQATSDVLTEHLSSATSASTTHGTTTQIQPVFTVEHASSHVVAAQQEQETQDAFAYLAATTSIDEYAYMTAPSPVHATGYVEKDLEDEKAFDYLSASTSIDEYAYLTTADVSTHTSGSRIHLSSIGTLPRPGNVLTNTSTGHHTASAAKPLESGAEHGMAATDDPNMPANFNDDY